MMAHCKRNRCGHQLSEYQWGEGYCSRKCMERALCNGTDSIASLLHDPTDPSGQRVIAETAEQVDAMLAAYEIDPRLPRIIYMRKREMSYRQIGLSTSTSHNTPYRLLEKMTSKHLMECGLAAK